MGWYECYNEKESPGDSMENVDSKRKTLIPGQCRDLCLWNSGYKKKVQQEITNQRWDFFQLLTRFSGNGYSLPISFGDISFQ
jgi:hypothetical protein